MFGDNKSVVDSSMKVNAKLHKRHTILSFHRVRECIASKTVGLYFIPGESNPADILSKYLGLFTNMNKTQGINVLDGGHK
jgi:hypothetical protein